MSKNYQETYCEYHNRNYTDELLRMLRGEVFHLTSKQAFDKIKRDGFIYHNQKERYALNASSANSFGRKQGWVCLLDLRNKSKKNITEALINYYFLWPPWLGEYQVDFAEMNLAYLILDARNYDKLVLSKMINKSIIKNTMHVPEVECWYPGDLPFSFIRESILVKIMLDAPKDDRLLYAHHLRGVMFGAGSKMIA